jgi:hypothetical protein
LKYYMKVVSSNFYKSSNFIEWELAEWKIIKFIFI